MVIAPDINKAVVDGSNIVDISLYYKQLTPYLDLFPREQIHIEFFEDFKSNPGSVMNRILQFIGCEMFDYDDNNLSRARNTTIGQKGDNRLLMTLRNVPGMQNLKHLLPETIKSVVKKPFKTKLKKPKWDANVLSELSARIRPDSSKFLDFVGRDESLRWTFED